MLERWQARRRSSMREPAVHRMPSNWRRRPIFALIGLRRPHAEHTLAEGQLLRRYAGGARTAVEIGVAEGGSAFEIRQALDPEGTLYLIDPYPLGRFFGRSAAKLVARRLVNRVNRGRVCWIGEFSHDAVRRWEAEIDFLLIDGDHAYDAVKRDWEDWTPHVRPGGLVALHDASLDASWTSPDDGPVRLAEHLLQDTGWEELARVDSTVILRKRGSAGRGDDGGVTP